MRNVYLDHAATTPVHPKVLEAMLPYFSTKFGNPSNLHDIGREAKNAVEEARARTAALIGAKAGEIFFTSSGAESNNFALKGLAQANSRKGSMSSSRRSSIFPFSIRRRRSKSPALPSPIFLRTKRGW